MKNPWKALANNVMERGASDLPSRAHEAACGAWVAFGGGLCG